jgi:phage-related protein
VIIGLVALGAALVVLWTRSETFRRIAGQAWTYVQAQAQRFVAWFQGIAMPAIRSVLGVIRALWARFGAQITSVVRAMANVVIGIVRTWLNIIRHSVEFFLAILRGDWSQAWNSLKALVATVLRGVVSAVRNGLKLIVSVVKGLGSALLDLAGLFLGWGKDLGRAIIDGIISALRGAAGALSSALQSALPKPGGGVPFIPGIQTGVRNFAGGLAVVGERGPELVNLPRGTDVFNARQTRTMLASGASTTPGPTLSLRGIFEGASFHVRDDRDVDLIADAFGRKLVGILPE